MVFRRRIRGSFPFRLMKKPKLRSLVFLLFLSSAFTIYHALDDSFFRHLARLSHAKSWSFLFSMGTFTDDSLPTSAPTTRESQAVPSSIKVPSAGRSGYESLAKPAPTTRESRAIPSSISVPRRSPSRTQEGKGSGSAKRKIDVKLTPTVSPVASPVQVPLALQLTRETRSRHRCWTEPCKFLFPGVIGEQLTKASVHFYQLALLARELNRTIVVPHVADSRIESCLKYPFATYFDTRGLEEIDWIEISEWVELIRQKFRDFKKYLPLKGDKTVLPKETLRSSTVSKVLGQLKKAKSAYAQVRDQSEAWDSPEDIFNEDESTAFDSDSIEEPVTQSRISTILSAQPNRIPSTGDTKTSADYNWSPQTPFASLIPGSSSYNERHSITSPPWISAQYLVFSEKSLPDNVDRKYPRGLRELLKCYRAPVNNSDGFPANPLPFNRPLLNFVPPENQLVPDDSAKFTPKKSSPEFLEYLRRRAEEEIPQEDEDEEVAAQNALHRLAVFAKLRSLASVEVLGLHYTWRKPRLFPNVMLSPLDYNPALWARARHITSKYLPRPFIAVHWRMETVDPRGMPACADMLADHIQKLKRTGLDDTQDEENVKVKQSDERDRSEFGVYLANDLPPIQGKLLRHRATTFMNASDLYYVGRNRLFDAVPKIFTWQALSSLDVAESGVSKTFLPGEEESDTGILGILDKLVCALADHFVAGPVGCSKGSSFTEQIVVLRSDRSRWISQEVGAAVPVDPGAPKEKKTVYNVIDSWPEPTVKLVREVGKEFGVVIEKEWEDWMDWSGDKKGSRNVEGGRYVYGGV